VGYLNDASDEIRRYEEVVKKVEQMEFDAYFVQADAEVDQDAVELVRDLRADVTSLHEEMRGRFKTLLDAVDQTGVTVHFLMIYDRLGGTLLEVEPYEDGAEALRARFDRERERGNDQNLEIVVLTARSLDHLRQTHARYFKGPRDLASGLLQEA
jgi:type I site-specific restriction-modification system R (restriction) subunit